MNKLTTPEQAAKLKRLGMPQQAANYYSLVSGKMSTAVLLDDGKDPSRSTLEEYIAIHTLHDANDWLNANYGYWVSTTVSFASGLWEYGFSGKGHRQSLYMFPDQYAALSAGITSILNIIK
jgi:hypothetical protein